ncbi:MAG: NusG domain II-containing protein [Bacilli bacterium]|jgi:hypothetical protein
MNKHDLILTLIIIIGCGIFFMIEPLMSLKDDATANVYYENKLVLSIDLTSDGVREYTVLGYNGDVIIEKNNNQIRVKEENSPLHLCSKQGWISSSLETIVCLPNKIIIKIEASSNEVDAVVR